MSSDPVNIYEYETLAKERLPQAEYDFIAGAATDEITLRRTRAVFDAIMLRPRMLVDISQPDLSTTVLGQRIPFPILVDPAGGHGRAHPQAELATVRAAGAMGTVMILSSGSTYTLEDVAQAATGTIWFQQYLYKDQGLTQRMAHRAQEAGYTALCLTLDSTVRAKRERNIRNDYSALRPQLRRAGGAGVRLADEFRCPAGSIPWSTAATWSAGLAGGPHAVTPGGQGHHDRGRCPPVRGAWRARDYCLEPWRPATGHHLRQYRGLAGVVEAWTASARSTSMAAFDAARCAESPGARRPRRAHWAPAVLGSGGGWGGRRRRGPADARDELEMAMGMCGRPTIASIDRSLLGTVSPLLSVLQQPPGLQIPSL